MTQQQKEERGWEFIFLGANIDDVEEASLFGIEEDRAVNYNCDEEGTSLNYEVLAEFTEKACQEFKIPEFLLGKIRDDYEKRRK